MKAHCGALGGAAQGGAKETEERGRVRETGDQGEAGGLEKQGDFTCTEGQLTTVELGAWKTKVEPVGVRMTAKVTGGSQLSRRKKTGPRLLTGRDWRRRGSQKTGWNQRRRKGQGTCQNHCASLMQSNRLTL